MSAAASMALSAAESRRLPRYPLSVAMDVIALRSGVPENIPGRCTDLGEGGVGAVIAGELVPGQQVAVELRLPDVGIPLRARALVRYQGNFRCGLEFVAFPAEQRQMIKYWSFHFSPPMPPAEKKEESQKIQPSAVAIATASGARIRIQSHRFYLFLAAMLLLATAGWWQWHRSWSELETGVQAAHDAPLQVPAETMAMRIVSKVDPVYPEEARRAGKHGLAVLDAVIAPDGTVQQLRTLSGDDLLVKAAADAVRRWKFEPYLSSGRPIQVETTVAVEFELD